MIKLLSPFLIKLDGLPEIYLSYVDIDELKPHEEADPKVLEATRNYITKGRTIRDPVIVDRKTGVILDGTHRYAVAKELNLKYIPAACVDYQDNRIKVKGWFMVIMGGSDVIRELRSSWQKTDHPRPGRVTLHVDGEFYSTDEKDPMQSLRDADQIKRKLEAAGAVVIREPRSNKNLPTLILPYPNKAEVVGAATSGQLFPPKSTRHVVPGRPINLNCHLDSDKNIRDVVFRRTMKLIRPQTKIGKRVFEEEVLYFQRRRPP